MKESLLHKLNTLMERQEKLKASLNDPAVFNDSKRYCELSKEYAQLEPVITEFQRYQKALQEEKNARQLLEDNDADVRELAQQELLVAQEMLLQSESALQVLLLPEDPLDEKNVFLEVRAGTGGDEAAIFAGDLLRMYLRYAEREGWQSEIISESLGEKGGYKEAIVRLIGDRVYSRLKFESGVHRVQRVPETEAKGRVHTSACTVAVLPEADEITDIEINPADLRIDTYRASGAGGQHVNRTDSAVRITHLPSGVVVECQDERSQHKNRARAMSLLKSRLLSAKQKQQADERAATRRNLVGSGDRSEKIRTYNFPQNRLTDHRIELTLYQLDRIMDGDLNSIIDALSQEHQADLLAAIDES